jgi:ketosteroid isomerase-like protein
MSENREIVQSAYDSFAKGDVEGVLGILSDRVEWDVTSVIPQAGSFRGRDSVAEFFQSLGEHWSELKVDPEQLVSDGDTVVAIGRAVGKLRGHGDAAAGYTFVHGFRLADGQVTRFREWADPDAELTQHMSHGAH